VHFYINPERAIDFEASEVHGLTWERLKNEPRFAEIADQFLDFAKGAEWLAHNASFDIAFLDAELAAAGKSPCSSHYGGLVDTLAMARERFPGRRNNLDALCERLGVSNAHRTLHGALLDAEILAEVYLSMTRGQNALSMDLAEPEKTIERAVTQVSSNRPLLVIQPTAEELAEHEAYLDAMEKAGKVQALWRTLDPKPAP
jgi:DNA polymerase-3 subunit epsilon